MRKIKLAMILAFFVPNIVLAGPDLFETKPKQMPVPEMIKPDVGVTPYDKKSKDFEVIPEQPPLKEANPAPRVVNDSIDCYGNKIKIFVEFDKRLPKRTYGGAIEYFTTDSNINHIFARWDLYDGAKIFTAVVPAGLGGAQLLG